MPRYASQSYVTRSELDQILAGVQKARSDYKREREYDPVNFQKACMDSLEKLGEKNPFLSQLTRQLSGIMGGLITPYLHDQSTIADIMNLDSQILSDRMPYSFEMGDPVLSQSLMSAKHMMTEHDEFSPNPRWVTPYKVATSNFRRKCHENGRTAMSIADDLDNLRRSSNQ